MVLSTASAVTATKNGGFIHNFTKSYSHTCTRPFPDSPAKTFTAQTQVGPALQQLMCPLMLPKENKCKSGEIEFYLSLFHCVGRCAFQNVFLLPYQRSDSLKREKKKKKSGDTLGAPGVRAEGGGAEGRVPPF